MPALTATYFAPYPADASPSLRDGTSTPGINTVISLIIILVITPYCRHPIPGLSPANTPVPPAPPGSGHRPPPPSAVPAPAPDRHPRHGAFPGWHSCPSGGEQAPSPVHHLPRCGLRQSQPAAVANADETASATPSDVGGQRPPNPPPAVRHPAALRSAAPRGRLRRAPLTVG